MSFYCFYCYAQDWICSRVLTCFGIFDGFGIGMYGKKRTCMVWYGMVRLLVLVLAWIS